MTGAHGLGTRVQTEQENAALVTLIETERSGRSPVEQRRCRPAASRPRVRGRCGLRSRGERRAGEP